MIYGDGVLADGFREAFGQPRFPWLLYSNQVAQECDTRGLIETFKPGRTVAVSTPIRCGTIAYFEAIYPHLNWVYVPENVREAHPEDWYLQSRFIIGTRHPRVANTVENFLSRGLAEYEGAGADFHRVSPETAELVKPAINGFLAMSILYATNIARLARVIGANPEDVAEAMKSDPRIGQGAYVGPTGDLSSHLLRELRHLDSLGFEFFQHVLLTPQEQTPNVRSRRRSWLHRKQSPEGTS